jgi:hypothetical protein
VGIAGLVAVDGMEDTVETTEDSSGAVGPPDVAA